MEVDGYTLRLLGGIGLLEMVCRTTSTLYCLGGLFAAGVSYLLTASIESTAIVNKSSNTCSSDDIIVESRILTLYGRDNEIEWRIYIVMMAEKNSSARRANKIIKI